MARSIEFDYDQALERATRLFWRDGYAGTSLRDLLKVIGIGEGSFYNTLKSKKRLYIECLKRYSETEGQKRRLALMSAPTASEGIRGLFGVVLDCLDDPKTPSRLCLMAGMVTEDVLADPDLKRIVQDGTRALSKRIAARLASDKKQGKLQSDFNPQIIATVITTYLQGLWRMALLSYHRPEFERQINVFLSGLGL
jgi:TetR/AcrR family transcriptional regulator, transcriptional repressor for nem operon